MEDNYSKLADIAYNLHISGKFDDAAAIYKKLLSLNPEDINVLNLYAQLNVSLKNYDLALDIFDKVYEKTNSDAILINIAKIYFFKSDYEKVISELKKLKENNADSVKLYAITYQKAGNKERAIINYKALADNNAADFSDLYNLAYLSGLSGNKEDEEKYALEAYKHNPDDIDINKLLANIYQQKNDENNELKYLLNLSKTVKNTEILYRIGVIYSHLNNDGSAIDYFNQILNIEPNNTRALLYIGLIYKNHDKMKAVEIFEKLYNLDNNNENVLFNLATVSSDILDFEKALFWAKKYSAVCEDKALGYNLTADYYMELYKYDLAEEYYLKSYNINKNNDYTKIQLAYIYSFTNRNEEAYKMYNSVNDKSDIEEDLTLMKLRNKELEDVREGFYNWNAKLPTDKSVEKKAKAMFYKLNVKEKFGINENFFTAFRANIDTKVKERIGHYLSRAWKNQDITGKSLLIYSLHGYGDMFMFSRYIKTVYEKTSRIILQVPKSCYELYKFNFPNLKIIDGESTVPDDEYDYAVPYMTLIYCLNASLKNIPYSGGYLSVSDKRIKEISNMNYMNTNKKKIGIFWQGNPSVFKNRSIKLKYLKPLFDIENIQIYSFQISTVDSESDELKSQLPLIDLSSDIKSFEDTAAFLKNIDILVTIDTSIANLSGALGVKTFLMLPYLTEWRWFNDTDKTPWYDSVKIFKQKIPGDWAEVVSRIKNEIEI